MQSKWCINHSSTCSFLGLDDGVGEGPLGVSNVKGVGDGPLGVLKGTGVGEAGGGGPLGLGG